MRRDREPSFFSFCVERLLSAREPRLKKKASAFLSNATEHADGERPRTRPDPKVPKDAPHRDISDGTLRLGPALGVRRRRAPKRLQK